MIFYSKNTHYSQLTHFTTEKKIITVRPVREFVHDDRKTHDRMNARTKQELCLDFGGSFTFGITNKKGRTDQELITYTATQSDNL